MIPNTLKKISHTQYERFFEKPMESDEDNTYWECLDEGRIPRSIPKEIDDRKCESYNNKLSSFDSKIKC